MSYVDWIVLIATQLLIVGYGMYKSRLQRKSINGYLLGNQTDNWLAIGISIMATQASAITFLSAPGQAYTDGIRFIQFYFGLPLAMIVLSVTAIPLYKNLKVFTAYEYLEKRFDGKVRVLAALLFLSQRGIAAGFTIFAPSLVLSAMLDWNIYLTNLVIGIIVVSYTVLGGTKAVSQTQKTQMAIILMGMFLAGYLMVAFLPKEIAFTEALNLAGKMNKLNAIDWTLNPYEKYNVWSGLIGGFFLALSYFGTDQSQVQRYLSGQSIKQSRLGLMFNGILKIPMQLGILLVGALLFVFYLFYTPPIFFNEKLSKQLQTEQPLAFEKLNKQHAENENLLQNQLFNAIEKQENELEAIQGALDTRKAIRFQAEAILKETDERLDTNDTNYIFFNFVKNFLPIGIIGLIISLIFSASMSSTASELNALATTTLIDIYKRFLVPDKTDAHYLKASKLFTAAWGLYAILFSMFANKLGTLIEAVNIFGSLVYGTILGIFVSAFYLKFVNGKAVLFGAIIAETLIIYLFKFTDIPFLWYNPIGCLSVMILAVCFQFTINFLKRENS